MHAEERARREVKVGVRARVRAVQGRSYRCAPRTLEACRGSGHGMEDRHQELTIAAMGWLPPRLPARDARAAVRPGAPAAAAGAAAPAAGSTAPRRLPPVP